MMAGAVGRHRLTSESDVGKENCETKAGTVGRHRLTSESDWG